MILILLRLRFPTIFNIISSSHQQFYCQPCTLYNYHGPPPNIFSSACTVSTLARRESLLKDSGCPPTFSAHLLITTTVSPSCILSMYTHPNFQQAYLSKLYSSPHHSRHPHALRSANRELPLRTLLLVAVSRSAAILDFFSIHHSFILQTSNSRHPR